NAPKEKQAWYYSRMQDTLAVMQEYRETGGVYWEMVGLYKDLFVKYYVEENWDYIYQISADGTGYAFSREYLTWAPFEGEVKGQPMSRYDAERLEDSWKAHR
ncbi:MAG: hypothetical protein IKT73_02525, partial [Anaerotignum sp.]|nr:hypothetical protein [Anaerotignum sp.]